MVVEYAGGMKLVAHYRGLEVASDQPEKDGGGNTAMTPTQLMVASLGMCVGVFILYFARRHEIAVEGMRIETDYEMVEGPRRVGKMQVRVEMPGELSDQERATLQRVAEQCVVHNTLTHPPEIDVSVM
jgi:putative redox protein